MVSLNWLNREELLAHLVPLKQTSLDCDNNVYMTEDDTVVVNFDKVVGEYGSRCGTSCARSVDALYCDRDGTCCLIEFKNGKLDKGKIFEIKQKIYDSLLILSDITGLTLKDYRSELEFILVYNKEKNPNLFNAFPAPSNSPALCGWRMGWPERAKRHLRQKVSSRSSDTASKEFVKCQPRLLRNMFFRRLILLGELIRPRLCR